MHRNAQVAVNPPDRERRRPMLPQLDTVKAKQISRLAVGKFELLL